MSAEPWWPAVSEFLLYNEGLITLDGHPRVKMIVRDGKVYYASLHTRDEAKACAVYERMEKTLMEWEKEDAALNLS